MTIICVTSRNENITPNKVDMMEHMSFQNNAIFYFDHFHQTLNMFSLLEKASTSHENTSTHIWGSLFKGLQINMVP